MKSAKDRMDIRKDRTGGLCGIFLAVIMMPSVLICGCSRFQAGPTFDEANDLFSQGSYGASLEKYALIMEKCPSGGDRALFEMGIIHAYPGNENRDYQKSLECFHEILKTYPDSAYKHESERMIFHIDNAHLKDRRIAAQQTMIDALRREMKNKEEEIGALRKKCEALEQNVRSHEQGPADKILVEKKERRLSLISRGTVFKTYAIALGRNPDGPKVRQGDNKTPEGIYFIDARNMESRYHLSLHISYPNEKDRKRAKALGVPPGGDIMIHGIKNGYSAVGGLHAEHDWTNGCIAVTDEEIEEIEKLVPNGTIVEIRP